MSNSDDSSVKAAGLAGILVVVFATVTPDLQAAQPNNPVREGQPVVMLKPAPSEVNSGSSLVGAQAAARSPGALGAIVPPEEITSSSCTFCTELSENAKVMLPL